jgi:hypothetical protein
MTKEEAVEELKRLGRLLKAREGKQGYTANIALIRARIVEAQKVLEE